MKRTSFIFGILLLCLALPVLAAEKVTICHASGQDDTIHFVTLEISENAVYGNGGHFEENGTPQAGHELDYFGPCADEPDATTTTAAEATTTTQAIDESTTTTAPEVTTTTQVGGESTTTTSEAVTTTTTTVQDAVTTTTAQDAVTTTTEAVTTTTTEAVTTTTTAAEVTTTTYGGEESTTTTAPEATTTTAAPQVTTSTQGSKESTTTTTGGGLTIAVPPPVFEEASVVAGLTVTQAGHVVGATQQAAAPAAIAAPTITGLPFTGLDSGVLALIALALALAGTVVLKSASIKISPTMGDFHSPKHVS